MLYTTTILNNAMKYGMSLTEKFRTDEMIYFD